MSMPRNEQIRLAEQVRSTIVATIKAAKEPMTIHELKGCAAVLHHFDGAVPTQEYMDRLVRSLHSAGVLRRVHVYRKGQNSRYAYEVVAEGERKVVHIKPASGVQPPDVQLDVIKNSGRIRIKYQGLCIEIGVIP